MKYIAGIFGFLFLSFIPGEQYQLVTSIPFSQVSFLTSDPLGNVYVVAANQLLRFDSRGKPAMNFSENSLGELRSVDVSNPLKPVLFYPDFAEILTLNAQLALQSTVFLRAAGIVQPTLACSSLQDGFWIFDLQDFQLKKIDLNLQLVAQSGDLSKILGHSILPDFLIESNEKVYLNDPERGIFVFDLFGTYYKTIPILHLKTFQVIDDRILYIEGNKLRTYHLKTIAEDEILLPEHDSLTRARIEQHQLYLLTSASLNFYSF